jgi:hypothetical protein
MRPRLKRRVTSAFAPDPAVAGITICRFDAAYFWFVPRPRAYDVPAAAWTPVTAATCQPYVAEPFDRIVEKLPGVKMFGTCGRSPHATRPNIAGFVLAPTTGVTSMSASAGASPTI